MDTTTKSLPASSGKKVLEAGLATADDKLTPMLFQMLYWTFAQYKHLQGMSASSPYFHTPDLSAMATWGALP